MGAIEIRVAMGSDDEQPDLGRRAEQVVKKEQRGPTRPLQVVGHPQRRLVDGQPPDEVGDRQKHPVTFGFGIAGHRGAAEPRQQPCEVAGALSGPALDPVQTHVVGEMGQRLADRPGLSARGD
jgi:hypothetical protein